MNQNRSNSIRAVAEEARDAAQSAESAVRELRNDIRMTYLSKDKYEADQQVNAIVRNLVFGLVALILVGFVTALIALVIR